MLVSCLFGSSLGLGYSRIPSKAHAYPKLKKANISKLKRRRPDNSQDKIIKAWQEFFGAGHSDSVIHNAEHDVRFPALEFLVLNFERLQLGTEALTVCW